MLHLLLLCASSRIWDFTQKDTQRVPAQKVKGARRIVRTVLARFWTVVVFMLMKFRSM